MITATIELFLSEYFLFKAVLGNSVGDEKNLFDYLNKIFMIPTLQSEQLFCLISDPSIQQFNTKEEYQRRVRIHRFVAGKSESNDQNDYLEEIVKIKGNAILLAEESGFLPSYDATQNMILDTLTKYANSGRVQALKILGVMQCLGIVVEKNKDDGLKKLNKAAEWNDCFSNLCLAYNYQNQVKDYNFPLNRLRLILIGTPLEELYRTAHAKYGDYIETDAAEVVVLNKAFKAGVLKPEVIDAVNSRLIYSYILSEKDKEKTLFSADKIYTSNVLDLPLRLKGWSTNYGKDMTLDNMAIQRKGEIERIIAAFNNTILVKTECYHPICICSNSKYLLRSYCNAISEDLTSGRVKTHCEVIDVANLSGYDVEPTANNVFLRSIDENRHNVIILDMQEDVDPTVFDQVKNFLQTAKRAKFHLCNPNVTLNLKSVLPVCLCNNRNAQKLKNYCDVIALSPVNAQEFDVAVGDIISDKQRQFGDIEIKLDGNPQEIFGSIDVDFADEVITFAILNNRLGNQTITLNRDVTKAYTRDSKPMGFKE
ncbi:MAG: hypothetical protein ACI4MY_04875 [Christensenellales bacterium]